MVDIYVKNIKEYLIVDIDKAEEISKYSWRFSPLGMFITNKWVEELRTVDTLQKILFPGFLNKHIIHKNNNILDWRTSNIELRKKFGVEKSLLFFKEKRKQVELLRKRLSVHGK